MWYGRIKDLNIWKDEDSNNVALTNSPRKEIQFDKETVIFYMGGRLLDTDITMLNLTQRPYNCLKRAGWNTIGDILRNIDTQADLQRVRNLGKTSANEIMNCLKAYQSTLVKDIPQKPVKKPQTIIKPVFEKEHDLGDFELSLRSYNCLKRAGYNTAEQLKRDIALGFELRKIRNLGEKSEKEIINILGI